MIHAGKILLLINFLVTLANIKAMFFACDYVQ